MKTWLMGIICAALFSLGLTSPGMAADKGYKAEYKLSSVLGKPHAWGVASERWAELITEGSQGRITVRVFPGASLVGGNQTSEFTALRQGAIDLAVGGTNNWSSQVKELMLFALPFLMPDSKAQDALTGGEVGKEIFRAIADKGVMPLAWGDNGFRELSNAKRPVRTPNDLKGLKIRVVGSPMLIDTFNALGANPTQMSWADAQPALSTGAVDGQENPVSIFAKAKLHTLGQKHMTIWGCVASPLIFAVNQDVWKSWSPADQELVRAAAIEAARENVAMARKGVTTDDDSALRELQAEGVEIVQLTPAEIQVFRQAAQSVYDKWTKNIGAELVNKAETAVARH
ncbi:MAG: C4-dicarboxylate ABC transporter [Desulfobulbaceae bacterium A2]|nr:MAG: C4-dicarboxylate ABC transporter [Desulfobulbaceae bacterium A2]